MARIPKCHVLVPLSVMQLTRTSRIKETFFTMKTCKQQLLALLTACRTQLVFLGLDGRRSDGLVYKDVYKGAPFFALDVTPRHHLKEEAENLISHWEAKGFKFALSLKASQAAMYAEGRHLLDWNTRNPFCAGCGQPTLSINGGWKHEAMATWDGSRE